MAINDDGKPLFYPVMSFELRAVADAFSAAVIIAVLKHSPRAFDESPSPSALRWTTQSRSR